MVYYPLVLIQFVLNFFADSDPRLSDYPPVEVYFSKCITYINLYIYTITNF